MTTTSSERRLHPLSILFEAGGRLPGLVLPMLLLFFASSRDSGLFVVTWVGGISAIVVIIAAVRYIRFTYRYDAREMVIRSGLFTRNERKIPYVRIQNLDAAQSPLQRLFGVVVVYVQTGGGAEPEAALRVLPAAALDEMRARVLAAGGRAHAAGTRRDAAAAPGAADGAVDEASFPAEAAAVLDGSSVHVGAGPTDAPAADTPARRTLLALEPEELVLAGFIENRGMVLIAGALALLEQAGVISRIADRMFAAEGTALAELAGRWLGGTEIPVIRGALYVFGAVLAILLFIRVLSTIWAVVRLYGFRLERVGDELHTEYGLFTRVSATIPLRRIQTIIVRDGMLHRLFGRRIVNVETAGGLILDASAPRREPIAPILPIAELPALLQELHPGLDLDGIAWQPVHPRAFGRMVRASLTVPVVVSAASYLVVANWAIAVFAALFAVALGLAGLRARYLAWSLTHDSIIVRDGALRHTTRIARFSRVQVAALQRNPFDIRTGMAGVRADTAGAGQGVVIPYLPEHTADAVHAELAARTAETAFTW